MVRTHIFTLAGSLQLDDWLREWGADADQTRVLYKAVATAYKECGVTYVPSLQCESLPCIPSAWSL